MFVQEYGYKIVRTDTFICYALRSGFIRVIGVQTGNRALLKQHSSHVGEIVFAKTHETDGENTLASVGIDGQVCEITQHSTTRRIATHMHNAAAYS